VLAVLKGREWLMTVCRMLLVAGEKMIIATWKVYMPWVTFSNDPTIGFQGAKQHLHYCPLSKNMLRRSSLATTSYMSSVLLYYCTVVVHHTVFCMKCMVPNVDIQISWWFGVLHQKQYARVHATFVCAQLHLHKVMLFQRVQETIGPCLRVIHCWIMTMSNAAKNSKSSPLC
jgi:hypothetical protein